MVILTNPDDDDDMANPYNVDLGSDDADDELDEEDDEVHWIVWGMQQYIYSIYFDLILR